MNPSLCIGAQSLATRQVPGIDFKVQFCQVAEMFHFSISLISENMEGSIAHPLCSFPICCRVRVINNLKYAYNNTLMTEEHLDESERRG